MSPSTPDVRADGDQVVVEAPTAEAALELVAERLGTRAQIASVERVRRGGVGGFFARELVQVTAVADVPAAGGADDTRTAADVVLERIERDDPFSAVLREQLEAGRHTTDSGGVGEPESVAPASAPDVDDEADRDAGVSEPGADTHDLRVDRSPPPRPDAVAVPDWATRRAPSRLPGTPRWTLSNLSRLGLAGLLSEADVAGLDAVDDIGWTTVLARRLTPLCVPPPDAPTIVVGPRAGRLADALKLVVCRMGGSTPRGSFIAPIGDSAEERAWLRSVRGTRRLHLMVGDARWRGLLFEEPSTLSWTDGGLCDAIGLAAQLGLRLGWTVPHAGTWSRCDPIDLAVAVRRLLASDS